MTLSESGEDYVILLLSTLGSLHRVAFPHPRLLDATRSIFSDAAGSALKDYYLPSLPGQVNLTKKKFLFSNRTQYLPWFSP